MKKRSILLILSLFLVSSQIATKLHATESEANDETQIRHILDEFMRCIVDKDKEAFLPLFIEEPITWIGVSDPIRREDMLEKRPEYKGYWPSSHEGFIDWICGSETRIEEKFWNIEITHDASVAAVTFDFTFNENGVVTNWGKESWHLVKSVDGWKICSVIFTLTNTEKNPYEGKN